MSGAPLASKPGSTFDHRLGAVEASINSYHVYLERYLVSLTHNHADAEDLMSRLWVTVLHNFKDEHIRSLPILRRKAYQLFVDYYRQKVRRREDLLEKLPELPMQHVGKEAHSAAEESALKNRFWSEFPVELPEGHKEVLWLHARYGFTIQEISTHLDLPSSTVGDRLQKARQEFAKYLNTL